MKLDELFNTVLCPNEADTHQFSAVQIPLFENHRLGKNKSNSPSLLLSVSNNGVKTANLQLQNVSVLFNVNCKIRQGKKVIDKPFTVISFVGNDSSLKKYFLKLCYSLVESIGNSPTQDAVNREINRFIELFRLASAPPIKTVQGLWAELFVILRSSNPSALLKYWHSIPEEKFDFNSGEERIEVKSTSNNMRIHNFSFEQLNPPNETKVIIASVFVKQANSGKNIETLQAELETKIDDNVELIKKLRHQIAETLGNSFSDAQKMKFDWQLAIDTLKFFKSEDVPKISPDDVPAMVSDVRFKANLSQCQALENLNLVNSQELFSSLI